MAGLRLSPKCLKSHAPRSRRVILHRYNLWGRGGVKAVRSAYRFAERWPMPTLCEGARFHGATQGSLVPEQRSSSERIWFPDPAGTSRARLFCLRTSWQYLQFGASHKGIFGPHGCSGVDPRGLNCLMKMCPISIAGELSQLRVARFLVSINGPPFLGSQGRNVRSSDRIAAPAG